ncbi:MAG: acyltransferase [Dinghuibacter sp.]|nr:acyltransferase [Dinghuibacter sp.]
MRLRQIDFLRGIAIILVLFRHMEFTPVTHLIGWSGVDLFFVLSGFLVSGLLFEQYAKEKTVKPLLFLTRRGFKIYPLFYILTAAIVLIHQFTGFGTNAAQLVPELLFYQNYSEGINPITWSLAVEEHFYILLVAGVYLAVRAGKLTSRKGFHAFAITVLLYSLIARVFTSLRYTEFEFYTHYTPTHLRIDSLLFGVIIAWNYYFNRAWLLGFVQRFRKQMLAVAILCLAPLFFFDTDTFYMRTIGLSFLYLGFGSLLCLFLYSQSFNRKFERIVPGFIYKAIAKTGIYSYAIYLVHIQVLNMIKRVVVEKMHIALSNEALFLLYFGGSILAGMMLYAIIEMPFLKLRERVFPKHKTLAKPQPEPKTGTLRPA